MSIVLASRNNGKLKELKSLLVDQEILSAREAGINEDVIEDGFTFTENALKKARFVASKTDNWVVADDSGICIEALNGEPGIHSARWAGENKSDENLIQFTLDKMKNIPSDERQAYFICSLVLISPTKEEYIFEGRVNGNLTFAPQGINRPGLPYDLIFIPDGCSQTFAQMSDEAKNNLSHRGRALEKLKDFFNSVKE
jgi:XTP/dITP diphosphohydrolase